MFKIGEFKGNPTITLKQNEEDRYGLTFGLVKAKLNLDHLEAIKQFYADHSAAPTHETRKPPTAE